MAVPVRLLLALAPALLACGDDPDGARPVDAAPGVPDAPSIAIDAATIDASTVDAATVDAAPDPGPNPRRFTLAVVPDTQYLFDQDRGNPEVLATSLRWIVDHAADEGIAFSASLGDIVENAGVGELAEASTVYGILDAAGLPYSVVAGNHDLRNQRSDDQRAADEPYLARFPPSRWTGRPGFVGGSPSGYNTAHVFTGGGRSWLVLALDWRVSATSLAWAQAVVDAHPTLPTIVTTHDLAFDGGDGPRLVGDAALSAHGQLLWDQLIRRNDQIFLTLNGHYWPAARAVMTNDAGHDVHVHVTNYQDRYFGGSGMIRLYRFDLAANRVEVSTFSPWVLAQAPAERDPLELQELELVDADNRFTVAIDFAARFAGFAGGPPEPPPVSAAEVVVPGTVAYWRFEGTAGAPVPDTGVAVRDLSGAGNDLVRVDLAASPGDLAYDAAYDPRAPSRGSIFVRGSRQGPRGAYLRTASDAPLNALTFASGYTIEAFVRLPADCCGSANAWMGILARAGTGRDLGRSADDPDEPQATLAVPPGGGLQWAVWPTSAPGILTSWSHSIRPGSPWLHVALVNNGTHTIMYVDGAPVLSNPRAANIGLATTGQPWLIAANHYANVVEQTFYGWLGDVRIVDRPLPRERWMLRDPQP
jgi:hypothetical protein